jgi:hypothetical protein
MRTVLQQPLASEKRQQLFTGDPEFKQFGEKVNVEWI